MTNREKAERCGEFAGAWLECLDQATDLTWEFARDDIVDAVQKAAHWGRLALAEVSR